MICARESVYFFSFMIHKKEVTRGDLLLSVRRRFA